MAICPKCSQPVADEGVVCPACGHAIPAQPSGTLDIAQHFEDAPSEVPVGEPADELDLHGTLAASPDDALDFELGSADQEEISGTLGAPPIPDSYADLGATMDSSAGISDDDSIEEDFVLANQTLLEPSDQSDSSVPVDVRQTLPFDNSVVPSSSEIVPPSSSSVKSGSGGSGTAGKLKRLWQGAVGSSQNPMRTLKGAEALASDSVFSKVARRVLVKDPEIDVSQSAPSVTSSQSSRKARVQECIQAACQGADSEKADYDLTGFLGQGGMGVVLKAYQRAIGREVALKMIQPSVGSTSSDTNAQKKKFFYEAQITGKLDHPNIVPIYELGISNDVLFYSMKKIDGKEWKDLLQEKSREDNLDILMKVCDAIAFAHQRQIIHRDLKPENVMIGAFGEVLVTDWGCAIDLASNESFGCAGSPPWMAPEMAEHNRPLIGPRSDVYLLGAMLYQVIAGYPPHPGQTVFECVAAAQKNIIIPLGIQDPLLDIALKAMAKHPDDRYQTVEELQQDIRIYRRNAESITLTERSEALLALAISSKDYERFSRTLFGFQDAIELWPENTAAKAGLAKARLAYGECAYSKNDYDLCLSILDRSVPVENELYVKAEKAKRDAELRVSRFKTLRRTFAASVLALLLILSGVTAFALSQSRVATLQALFAKGQSALARYGQLTATLQTEIAETQKLVAQAERDRAFSSANQARRAEYNAQDQSRIAILAATRAAKEANLAVDQTIKANAANILAQQEAERANTQAAKVELKNVESKLALALSQVAQRDVASATQELSEVTQATADGYPSLFKSAGGKLPKLDNWAVERIKLLSNQELLLENLGPVDAVTFAQAANRGVIATHVPAAEGKPESGVLNIVELQEKRLVITRSLPIPAQAAAITITPNGKEIVYSLKSASKEVTLFRQKLDDGAPPERVVDNAEPSAESGLAAAAELQSVLSSDEQVLTGISRGLWVWRKTGGDWRATAPQQIESIRGRLMSMQLMDDTHALVLVELDGQRLIHNVDLENATSTLIELAPEAESDLGLKKQTLSVVAYSNNKLILGTEAGRMFAVPMSTSAVSVGPNFEEILPQQHQTAIHSIHAHADGTLLTAAAEPVVHVWRANEDQAGGWQFSTSLAGTPGNIGGMDFMISSGLVMGVDENGTALVWDVERQKQRKQLTRRDAAGNPIDYDSPVVQVVLGDDSERAVSIHADGQLDAWSLSTGKTLDQTSPPDANTTFNYIGHTPGATFVDMAIDPEAGILMTCAALPQSAADAVIRGVTDAATIAAAKSDESLLSTYEFCKWDIGTRKMLERWQVQSEKSQLVSLLERGKYMVYAEDDRTLIVEANSEGNRGTQPPHFSNESLGTYFAVAHPQQPNLAIMIKRSGAARIYNSQLSDGGWSNPNLRIDYDSSVAAKTLSAGDDVPLDGVWNPSGTRFYLVWESARVTEFAWENELFSIKRDISGRQLEQLGIALRGDSPVNTGKKGAVVRLNSRWQLDLKVRESQQNNLLHVLVHLPGASGRLQLNGMSFPKDEGDVTASKVDYQSDLHLYLTDDRKPQLSAQLLVNVPVSPRDVIAARTVGESAFLATADGVVYHVDNEQLLATFGRPAVIAATGDQSAENIVLLQDNGGMWRVTHSSNEWAWTPLPAAPAGAQSVAMSPDGSSLLITTSQEGTSNAVIIDSETGQVKETLAQVVAARWNPDGALAFVAADGQVHVRDPAGNARVLATVENANQVRSLHYFIEPWSDPAVEPKRWLMVQAEGVEGTEIEYLPLDGPVAGAEGLVDAIGEGANPPRQFARLGRAASILACSPSEGIFVVGSTGSVSVHFAAPSLKQYGEAQLFNLEGHAGANLTCILFSPDGQTLVTADDKRRLFGWMSTDRLNGIDDSQLQIEKIQ
jgi:serine/threonine protein kinase/WD40 repeat protein